MCARLPSSDGVSARQSTNLSTRQKQSVDRKHCQELVALWRQEMAKLKAADRQTLTNLTSGPL